MPQLLIIQRNTSTMRACVLNVELVWNRKQKSPQLGHISYHLQFSLSFSLCRSALRNLDQIFDLTAYRLAVFFIGSLYIGMCIVHSSLINTW